RACSILSWGPQVKTSLLRTAQLSISLLVSLFFLFTSIATGQSCEGFDYSLAGGGISGTIESRLDTFCTSSPQDLVQTYGDGLVVTIHNVYARGTNGGTASCTNYPKQIEITFSRPVADFQAGIFGAKSVTANGQTVNFSPELWPEGSFAPGR